MKVLHVAAEVFPLVKTGGLADVIGALPQALIEEGADLRLLLPGFAPIVDAVLHQKTVATFGPLFGAGRVTLRLGQLPYTHVPVYVIDAPYLYRRRGGPYQASDGSEWPDNLQRFALLGWIAAPYRRRRARRELDARRAARTRLACGDGLCLRRLASTDACRHDVHGAQPWPTRGSSRSATSICWTCRSR